MDLLEAFAREDNIFLPVIHTESEDQALRNIKTAQDCGADGVFLINHEGNEGGLSYHQLLSVYDYARGEFPTLWIGLNCLDLGLKTIEKMPDYVQGLWTDDTIINKGSKTLSFRQFEIFRKGSGWTGLYFGSVAFKYQRPTSTDSGEVAAQACEYVDIITTSGDQTGKPPSVCKIKNMREAIGDHPLAIASGMSPENVLNYVPYANCFLVATGISDSFTELSPKKALAFGRKLGK